MTTETNDLITEVTQLPGEPGAALRLLWMLDDPRTSAADLGRLIESDPSLSMPVIRLSNATFYGLSGKVSSAWRAVTVLGLATLRAVATSAAFDLFSVETARSVPDGFWEHSVTTAAASAAIAGRVGIQPNDAFSAGLLHDLGTALVFRRAPRRYDTAIDRRTRTGLPLTEIENEDLGASHAEVGAAALGIMRFPADVVEAVAGHHREPDKVASLLGRLLIAADAVALAVGGVGHEENVEIGDALEALELSASERDGLVEEVRRDRQNLSSFLTGM
jgi:putative nucleotidyltransferase with HDIG domain